MILEENNNENLLCSKQNIYLTKIDEHKYRIKLNSNNNKINFRNIINFEFFKILAEVNKKNIESCDLIQQISNDKASFLFKFKPLGIDYGIPKKYMFVETVCNIVSENELYYTSKEINLPDYLKKSVYGYDKITCHHSRLNIKLIGNTSIDVDYYFNIDINETLPIFAQNLLGFLMKKIFLNLKLFIENIT